MPRTKNARPKTKPAKSYKHPESESPMRPEVGTQAQFKKKLPPKTYRYDSSLSPALDWDGQNPAREQGEAAIREILEAQTIEQAKVAAAKLKAMSRPFLNWAGKAERLSFEVPTLPLFIHERLSTKAILETLKGHRRDKQIDMFDLWPRGCVLLNFTPTLLLAACVPGRAGVGRPGVYMVAPFCTSHSACCV